MPTNRLFSNPKRNIRGGDGRRRRVLGFERGGRGGGRGGEKDWALREGRRRRVILRGAGRREGRRRRLGIGKLETMRVRIRDITNAIEEAAPLSLQETYDNSGLIVGSLEREIESALICVDITEEVMQEAEEMGVQMIISHHPIIFHPLRRLVGESYVERVIERAIKNDIALYASHTNLDAVKGGISYRIADLLGVKNLTVLSQSTQTNEEAGFGVVGELEKAMEVEEFLELIKKRLNVEVIRHSELCKKEVKRVALCGGSGASLIETAAQANADLYIAADFKYNDFLDAHGRLIVADIGHFESEYCAIELLYEIITEKLATFALYKSRKSINPVNYSIKKIV